MTAETTLRDPLLTDSATNNSFVDVTPDSVKNPLGEARLYQNIPNPFTQSTQITFYIPAQAQSAHLYIYNLNGIQLKHIPITQRGAGSVPINGNEFQAGMYLYTLIIDNTPIDTKRMILTD